MRWFRHQCDLRTDPQVADYLARCRDRHAGYGVFLAVLEVVAGAIKPGSGGASAEYPLPTWRRLVDCHARTLQKQLELLADCGLIQTKTNGNQLRIEIPKLLNWVDEYTRKSGVPPDPDRRMSHQSESDSESESAKEDISLALAAGSINKAHRSPSPSPDGATLGQKIDAILDGASAELVMTHGRVDIDKLSRVINQRDGRRSEPSPGTREAVAKCVAARARFRSGGKQFA